MLLCEGAQASCQGVSTFEELAGTPGLPRGYTFSLANPSNAPSPLLPLLPDSYHRLLETASPRKPPGYTAPPTPAGKGFSLA